MTDPTTVTVTLPAWKVGEGDGDVTRTLPVGSTGQPGLYIADGTGVFGCRCVYRITDPGQPHDLVHEVDDCPWHGPSDDEDY